MPIEQLDLSVECIEYSKFLGFRNLAELTGKGWGFLQSMEGFNYIWFNEIVRFLGAKGLLNLLEDNDQVL